MFFERAEIVGPFLQSAQAKPLRSPRAAKLFHHAFDNLPFFATVDA